MEKIVSPEQSAFITGRQILDGPLMLSECIYWYKKKSKNLMIFKVGFEKAYDSVSWKYLDFILQSLGFGIKWRRWIQVCLKSARTSILVNGSRSSEFSLKHGLRQGDPLSSFLFILVMDGLHLALKEAVQLEPRDMKNIIRVLHVLYLALGLKINMNKSNVYGVGVSLEEVSVMDRMTGCTSSDFPFIYLGLPISSNMNLICNWKRLVDRFQYKLSLWKSNLISIGGRVTLIKSVLESMGIYYMSLFKVPETVLKNLERFRANFFWGGDESNRKLAWVKWDNVLDSFDKGGLGVGSLKAFNLALLQKWCWRLINNTNLLWVHLIKSIHGVEAGLDEKGCKTAGLWSRIVGTVNYLHSSGVIPRGTLIYKVGCGTKVRFWKDVWLGDVSLKEKYNRLFHLDRNGDCVIRDRIYNGAWSWDWCRHDLGSRNNEALVSLLSDIGNIVVDSGTDTCSWNIATGGIFSVGVTRNHIDNHMLPSTISHTRWNNVLPRKVNIFVWRFLLDRLPHRLNLSSRSLEITSILCPVCNLSVESSLHLFFTCDLASQILSKIRVWCEVPMLHVSSSSEWIGWLDN
ncbi:RNA-directed DNA polymerase, eukaryota, reverse transcriptase zinc-binding domain protein [Tanacetum coccineum]|uniref:RNA-directed DNA polymerase, eukaryota, reverse transcriptase zinc-binding domain protein n=1 Tax=Tanacetum coccineum TaxID=301880 RepID=A0ABQ5EKK0_9ASTR